MRVPGSRIMKPRTYVDEFITPTVKEFEREPSNVRKAFLACVVTYHFVDCAAVATGQENVGFIINQLKALSDEFQVVRDAAVLAKHFCLDQTKPGNRGRYLFKLEHRRIGRSASFDDGAHFQDGASWTDSQDVARMRKGGHQPVDILHCVLASVAAINRFLGGDPKL